MSLKKIIIVLFAGITLIACEKEDITKDREPYESQVIIECLLEPETMPKLFLSNSVEYFSSVVTPLEMFASNATVVITSPDGIDTLKMDSAFNFVRCRFEPFYIGSILTKYGQTYNLKVEYNGETFTASTTIDQSAAVITSTGYVEEFYDVYGEHEGVIIDYQDQIGSGNAYRYRLDRKENMEMYGFGSWQGPNCIGLDSVDLRETGRTIYTDVNLDGEVLNIIFEPVIKHKKGSTGILVVQSFDAKAAIFYDQLDRQKLAQTNPFIEPVFIETHIEGCLGIFGSVVNSDPVTYVYPE